MNEFSLSEQESKFYAAPRQQSPHQSVIGITTNYGEQSAKLAEAYYLQVVRAGGVPLLIPPLPHREVLFQTLNSIDGCRHQSPLSGR